MPIYTSILHFLDINSRLIELFSGDINADTATNVRGFTRLWNCIPAKGRQNDRYPIKWIICLLCRQLQRGSRRYYPTRLATTLTSGNAAIAGLGSKQLAAADMNKTMTEEEESNQGFVILETNYRVYAYTGTSRFRYQPTFDFFVKRCKACFANHACKKRFTFTNCSFKPFCPITIQILQHGYRRDYQRQRQKRIT